LRLAVFSDLHGNPYACEALMDAIEKEGPFDTVVGAGDLLFGGSNPARVADMLLTTDVQAVYGNTEEYLLQPEKTPIDERHACKWDRLQPVAYWVRKRIGSQRLNWIESLPFSLRFSPTDNPLEDLLIVHANPIDNELFIYPTPEVQKQVFGMVQQSDDDPDLHKHLKDVRAHTIAFGHLHFSHTRYLNGLQLVNVAACSISPYDKQERARFTIFTWSGKKWQYERHVISYDHFQEAKALLASDMPDRKAWAEHFR
jgi:hypothetical protein